jgi:deazaflavin-dependent oxidoreductase (nitroreductase family)
MPTLLLTTVGRRTGQAHTVPLPYLRDEGRSVVVASFAGNPKHPAWYLNLAAEPAVTVQDGPTVSRAVATTAAGEERTRLWDTLVARYPWYADYQQQTEREIPLVILTPAD